VSRGAVAKLRVVLRDAATGFRLGADSLSRLRLASQMLWFPARKRLPARSVARLRRVRVAGGVHLTYRLERGDVQTVREVWLQEIYRPPHPTTIRTAVDLGAHIGMTTVWLARRCDCDAIIAVEPSPANLQLLRRNLADNHVGATVLEAAVGAADGDAHFSTGARSNVGRVTPGEPNVRLLSVGSVLAHFPAGTQVDLMKLDVEGAERAVLEGDLSWCDRVRNVVLEVHETVAPVQWVTEVLAGRGFERIDPSVVRMPLAWYVRNGLPQ